jgi:predicted SnoaL-like aldol condensation-catalyzing enzyme
MSFVDKLKFHADGVNEGKTSIVRHFSSSCVVDPKSS